VEIQITKSLTIKHCELIIINGSKNALKNANDGINECLHVQQNADNDQENPFLGFTCKSMNRPHKIKLKQMW